MSFKGRLERLEKTARCYQQAEQPAYMAELLAMATDAELTQIEECMMGFDVNNPRTMVYGSRAAHIMTDIALRAQNGRP